MLIVIACVMHARSIHKWCVCVCACAHLHACDAGICVSVHERGCSLLSTML